MSFHDTPSILNDLVYAYLKDWKDFKLLTTLSCHINQSIISCFLHFFLISSLFFFLVFFSFPVVERDQRDEIVFEEAMEEVNKEAVNLDSLTNNIKDLGSQVGNIK